jgi:hypothetical protein
MSNNSLPLSTINETFYELNGYLYWKNRPNKSLDVSKPITRSNKLGYILVEYRTVIYRVHRILYQIYHSIEKLSDDLIIDHIDCNVKNNSKENLRESDKSTNGMNRGKQENNSTGYKGVVYHKKANKYMSQIEFNKKHYYLGLFDTPELAHKDYCEKASELHKEFFHP